MKHLLMTTAVVALTALPATAQTDAVPQGDQVQTEQGQDQIEASGAAQGDAATQDELVLGQSFQASDLIGKRLFMPRDGMPASGQATRPNTRPGSESAAQDNTAAGPQAGNPSGVQPDTQADALRGGQTGGQISGQQDNARSGVTGQTGTPTESPAGTQAGQVGTGTVATGNGTAMIQNRQHWQMIGEIRDVILNAEGDAEGLIIDAGGYLGREARELRVAMADVRFVPDEPMGGQLQQARRQDEPLQEEQSQTLQQQAQQQEQPQIAGAFAVVYAGDHAAFAQTPPYQETSATTPGEKRGSMQWGRNDRPAQDVQLSELSTEKLLGAPVYGADNEWLGEVSELSLGQNGEVGAIIIDVGGFLGMGQKPVALPIQNVQMRLHDRDELRVYVPHTEVELEAMEEWDDSDL